MKGNIYMEGENQRTKRPNRVSLPPTTTMDPSPYRRECRPSYGLVCAIKTKRKNILGVKIS